MFRLWMMIGLALAVGLSACKEDSLNQGAIWVESFNDALGVAWQVSDGWTNGSPFAVGWRADQVAVKQGKLVLTLDDQACGDASDCSGEEYASGEVQTQDALGLGRFEARLQAAAGKGLVNGFFLYAGTSGSGDHQEIDVEILGQNTRQVQFNYYVNGVGGHEKVVNLGFDAAEGFHTYRIVRSVAGIEWWVDGTKRYQVTGSNLPAGEMYLFFNFWAAIGAESWTGTFSGQGLPLKMKVDWVSYQAQVL